jgi:predicted DNA-binding transcriptional regulator
LSKDQAIGAAILAICILVSVFYVVTLFYPQWLNVFGMQITQANAQFWVIAVPILIVFIAILGIGAWIGWTMATTPPPKPIEEITDAGSPEAKKDADTQ